MDWQRPVHLLLWRGNHPRLGGAVRDHPPKPPVPSREAIGGVGSCLPPSGCKGKGNGGNRSIGNGGLELAEFDAGGNAFDYGIFAVGGGAVVDL